MLRILSAFHEVPLVRCSGFDFQNVDRIGQRSFVCFVALSQESSNTYLAILGEILVLQHLNHKLPINTESKMSFHVSFFVSILTM